MVLGYGLQPYLCRPNKFLNIRICELMNLGDQVDKSKGRYYQ
jgi:hypothetical protein